MNKTCLSLALISLTSTALATRDNVVYGEDNRVDSFETTSALFAELAESTAAMIPKASLISKGEEVQLKGSLLTDTIPKGLRLPVCAKERFSHQTVVSDCSGFLVGEDILVTAGHCMTGPIDCESASWVFNYKVSDSEQSEVVVSRDDVYECKEIISNNFHVDFAVIRLDRPARARPLKVATKRPENGTPLVMIGHPTGLPQKISDGAQVLSQDFQGLFTDLDAFGGNSGSAVFNAESGEVVGILVTGKTDYKHNLSLKCSEVNYLANSQGGEKVSSAAHFLPYLKRP